MSHLAGICGLWQEEMRGIPADDSLDSSWGPSDEAIMDAARTEVVGNWITPDADEGASGESDLEEMIDVEDLRWEETTDTNLDSMDSLDDEDQE